MKRTILGLLVAGIFFTSCDKMGGTSLKNDVDTLSYALGMDIGNGMHNMDSALRIGLNTDAIAQAIADVFAGKNEEHMTLQNAYEFIQVYLQKQEKSIFTEDSTKNAEEANKYFEQLAADQDFKKTESGLYYKITQEGKGANSEINDTLEVHYTLTLPNGQHIESTVESSNPIKFANRKGAMVAGFTEGMTLLNKGAKATLVLPAELAYGNRANPTIGPARALIFDVELVDIRKPVEKK